MLLISKIRDTNILSASTFRGRFNSIDMYLFIWALNLNLLKIPLAQWTVDTLMIWVTLIQTKKVREQKWKKVFEAVEGGGRKVGKGGSC